jgi:hypothetical protein
MARMSINRRSSNPTIAVLLMHGIEPTLDAWLDFNGVSDVYDAELLEVIPSEFCDEYEDRLRLNAYYERKFAELHSYKPQRTRIWNTPRNTIRPGSTGKQ